MNYCRDCEDILVDPIEWRYGFCLWCLSIRLEKLDEQVSDLWWDDDS